MAKAEKILTYGAAGMLVASGSLLQFAGRTNPAASRETVSAIRGGWRGDAASDGDRVLGRKPEIEETIVTPDFPRAPLCPGAPFLHRIELPSNLLEDAYANIKQVRVPARVTLLSRGAPVTSSDKDPLGDLEWVTDGEKQYDDGYAVELAPGPQWVQIDLGGTREIYLVWTWMGYKTAAFSFKDVIIRISDDPMFVEAGTVFNNDHDNSSAMGKGTDSAWFETNLGHPVPVEGVRGRYVRLYSNGTILDEWNQWIEVEVYGR